MRNSRTAERVMTLERCPRPACTGRDFALTPSNAHTPGP
jgi:hypothetical protein